MGWAACAEDNRVVNCFAGTDNINNNGKQDGQHIFFLFLVSVTFFMICMDFKCGTCGTLSSYCVDCMQEF